MSTLPPEHARQLARLYDCAPDHAVGMAIQVYVTHEICQSISQTAKYFGLDVNYVQSVLGNKDRWLDLYPRLDLIEEVIGLARLSEAKKE